MSASTAIGMVSASLRNLLVGEMRLTPAVPVTVLAPDEKSDARRINLFLYKITENAFLKNQDWTLQPGDPSRVVDAPLSLNLFYLLTPYAQNDPVTGNASAHQILGEAMRVLYENPTVPAAHLDPGLVGAREQLQIAGYGLDPEELSRLWSTFSQPFRLSVVYQVATVQLDRLVEHGHPMPRRVRRVGVPDVRAPYRPPAVTGMTPAAAAPGATLTFTGEYLTGWRADVTVGDRAVLVAAPLTGDTFTATLPANLAAGFHDVRVDVSALSRRTFVLEVTP
jgi:hypothetical protein